MPVKNNFGYSLQIQQAARNWCCTITTWKIWSACILRLSAKEWASGHSQGALQGGKISCGKLLLLSLYRYDMVCSICFSVQHDENKLEIYLCGLGGDIYAPVYIIGNTPYENKLWQGLSFWPVDCGHYFSFLWQAMPIWNFWHQWRKGSAVLI